MAKLPITYCAKARFFLFWTTKMSEDEIIVLIGSLAGSLIFWGRWTSVCLSVEDFGRARSLRLLGIAAPCLAGGGLVVVLRFYASHDVRDDLTYIVFYLVMGLLWLTLVMGLSSLCGLSFRDDWLERRNPGAAAAGTGALLGGMCAFAGGNIGDGPGWWIVVFCGALATAAFFLSWLIYARLSGAMELIGIERDLGAGIRLGGFLLLAGIITGRSVAGDWHDIGSTCHDFGRLAWPLLPYAVGLALIEASQGRSPGSARPGYSAGWIGLQAGMAALYLHWAGPWN